MLAQSIRMALKNMFKEIEMAQLRNPSLEYTSLINKLNDLLSHFRALINMRATINKRRAEGLEEDPGDDAAPPSAPDDDPVEYDF